MHRRYPSLPLSDCSLVLCITPFVFCFSLPVPETLYCMLFFGYVCKSSPQRARILADHPSILVMNDFSHVEYGLHDGLDTRMCMSMSHQVHASGGAFQLLSHHGLAVLPRGGAFHSSGAPSNCPQARPCIDAHKRQLASAMEAAH